MADTLKTRVPVVAADRGTPPKGLLETFEENVGLWVDLLHEGRYDEESDTERLIWKSLETLVRVAGVAGCSITLTDWNQELLVHSNGAGPERHTYNRDTMAASGTLGMAAMRSGKAEHVLSIAHDPMHRYPEAVRKNGYQSVACIPLGARGRVLGVLSFYQDSTWHLSPSETDLVCALAQSTGLSIDNSLLLSESRRNCLSTVQALVRSLEARDSVTSYHSLRVTQYATVLGEQIGLSRRDMRTLQFGAMLHDIGKIGIVSEILNKNGKLTPDEYDTVREHPVIGARIVETVDFLQDSVPIIRHHHECIDGTGYPDHLKGNEIPLLARIVTVPDVYDALCSERPYRGPIDPKVAIRMIREGAGTQFDPEIARLFISIHEAGGVKAPTSNSPIV